MTDILQALLSTAQIEVELAGLPPMTISLDPGPAGEPPNAIVSALRPAVTLRVGGRTIVRQAPYGEPTQGVPWGAVAVICALGGVGLLGWAVIRGARV